MWSATCCLILVISSSVLAQRVVDTQYGQVRSHVVPVDNGREQTTVDVWYGIPFANDTGGANRFLSPMPAESWTGIFEADTITPACPQSGVPDSRVSEDCLKLHIYAPTDTSQTYPVMVWITGGAYQLGAAHYYPGHFLASRGVIVVTVNYRVNQFGYSYTGNDACPGNAGMWDQQMGLKFVSDNIANFGGDPNRITLFGESAGATSTSLHMLSPASNKLFQQAIIESGSEQNYWALNPPASDPAHFTYTLAEDMGCDGLADDYAMMDCLRQVDWRDLVRGDVGNCTPGYICLGMAPVVDGPGGFMPQLPAQQRLDGDVMSGPIIAGINKEDGSIFTPIVAPAILFDDCCNRTYFEHCLLNNMLDFYSTRISNTTEEEMFHAMNWFYSPWPHIYDNNLNSFKLVELTTDVSFGVGWDKQLRDQSKLSPTFGYVYDYLSNRSSVDDWVGTYHAAEIDMVFGFPQLFYNPEVRNDSDLVRGGIPTVNDIEFTIFVQELWTNFAKFGNPTPTPVTNPINGGTYTWPQFTEDELNYIYMGESNIETIKDYRSQEYAFWNFYSIGIGGEELGITEYWDVYNPYDQVDTAMVEEVWRMMYPMPSFGSEWDDFE